MQLEPAKACANKALIVVPCLNEIHHIGATLRNILRDPNADKHLIVVVDGGSTDGTSDVVAGMAETEPRIRLLNNPKRIQSAGVNLAARVYGEDRQWLIRMDAHADYPEDFASSLIAEAKRTGADSVVVSMKSVGTSCFQRAAATAQNSVLGTGGSAHRHDGPEGYVDHGHHALFRMHAFVGAGGYDETQSHNEDAEFDCRLARSGGRIWLTRATRMGYYPRDRAGDLFRQYRAYGRGRATTALRHQTGLKLRQWIPAGVAPSAALLFAAPWIPLAALPGLCWIAACLALGCSLGAKEAKRCAFASGIAAMIMHLGWSLGFWSMLLSGGGRLRFRKPPSDWQPEAVQ